MTDDQRACIHPHDAWDFELALCTLCGALLEQIEEERGEQST